MINTVEIDLRLAADGELQVITSLPPEAITELPEPLCFLAQVTLDQIFNSIELLEQAKNEPLLAS